MRQLSCWSGTQFRGEVWDVYVCAFDGYCVSEVWSNKVNCHFIGSYQKCLLSLSGVFWRLSFSVISPLLPLVSTGTSLTVTPHCQRTAGAVGREVRSSERGEPSSLEKFSEEDGSEEDGGRTLFVEGYLVKKMGRILFISV